MSAGGKDSKEKMSQEEKLSMLLSKHQRDINRLSDEDKATRKRGLEKLLSDLPWEKKSLKKSFGIIFHKNLLKSLLGSLKDPVEKCRDYALKIIGQAIATFPSLDSNGIIDIVNALCARVGESPFPEPTEELRLTILDTLSNLLTHPSFAAMGSADGMGGAGDSLKCTRTILSALAVAATDSFPAAKRQAAELLCTACSSLSADCDLAGALRPSLGPLCSNAMHQHNKVRCASLRAILSLIIRFREDYQSVMREHIVMLLHRVLGDRNVGTRRELAKVCAGLLCARLSSRHFTAARQAGLYPPPQGENLIERSGSSLDSALDGTWAGGDSEAIKLLLVLCGDESDDVSSEAKAGFHEVAVQWTKLPRAVRERAGKGEGTMDFVEDATAFTGDAESALRSDGNETSATSPPSSALSSSAKHPPEPPTKEMETRLQIACDDEEDDYSEEDGRDTLDGAVTIPVEEAASHFARLHLRTLAQLLAAGVDGWTVDGQCRFLGGLESLIVTAGRCDELSGDDKLLELLLAHLGAPLRDDEAQVRKAAQRCCVELGATVRWEHLSALLVPRARGEVPGGDTPAARTIALRLLSCVLEGAAAAVPTQVNLVEVLGCVARLDLYDHREMFVREAAFILLRTAVRLYPQELQQDWPATHDGETDDPKAIVALGLVLVSATLGGESDVVAKAAMEEASLFTRSGTASGEGVLSALAPYFAGMLEAVLPDPSVIWTSSSPARAACDFMVREMSHAAWEHHTVLMPVMFRHVTPPERADKDSTEAIEAGYKAVRGEEDIPDLKDVDVRLQMLALLESMVRAGQLNWESGQFIGAAAEGILTRAVVPNLVWRVGRVEATVRKVALAVCHGLLKAGAAQSDAFFKAAPHLVPLLASNLDDMEASPRIMACMCLQVCFNRLRGAFGSEAVHELYPKLLKRLDDSSDQVRAAACGALESFFQCGPPELFKGTTADYSLDQLFIHLDDSDEKIQKAVLRVVVVLSRVDKALVEKKAEKNRMNHRTPHMCDAVVAAIDGYEIVKD